MKCQGHLFLLFLITSVLITVILVGCGQTSRLEEVSPRSPGVGESAVEMLAEAPPLVYADPHDAVPQFISHERVLIQEKDRAALGALWAVDARIIDGRGTTALADDYIWQGRDAIMDRYALAVFSNPPPLIDGPTDLILTCANDEADSDLSCMDTPIEEETVITTQNGVDRWQFVYEEGRWWILELAYSQ